MSIAEKACIALTFVFWALTSVCMFVGPSLKKLFNRPTTAPFFSDKQLHTLYIIFGLQAAVMLAQLILGLVAGLPIKDILLCVFIFNLAFPVPYGVHFCTFLTIHLTLKAKKQIQETGGRSE